MASSWSANSSAFGWDKSAIYTTAVGVPADDSSREQSFVSYQRQFFEFLNDFNQHGDFVYRDLLQQALVTRRHYISVSFAHLYAHSPTLATQLKKSPSDLLPLFEAAAQQRARKIVIPSANLASHNVNTVYENDVPPIQVTIQASETVVSIRSLNASNIGKLVEVSGIVIGASTVSAKAKTLHIMCRTCRHVTAIPVNSGFSGVQLPRSCVGPPTPGIPKECPVDPYVIMHDKCVFVDQQSIKLQEAHDLVPVGELPRHMVLSVDRFLTNKLMPGTRATIVGIYSVVDQRGESSSHSAGGVAIRTPYLRVVGVEIQQDQANPKNTIFSAEEEELFLSFSRRPDFVNDFARSIAPAIYGHDDIKKAVSCLLFGGSRKALPDGMRLRGDINVLLLGDPGVAKSQLLKFVERVAPIAVYTSGKGSSAAGLTASVIRDPGSHEFYLEGGAMVLADGGVVCIDEFDKMRDDDRVAIHEAMEQQTISIAKAGITTMLNSRTSVLAAANPLFGRYDDLKTPGENIDFQSTILSRFDMIFLLRDTHNERNDERIARHVMNIHKQRPTETSATSTDFDIETMKRFIMYAKSRCAPRLSEEAAVKLSSYFVQIRGEVRSLEQRTGRRAPVPITVRQLEAVIRISESLAKITLSHAVSEAQVDEAMRLFHCSTMTALEAGSIVDNMTIDTIKAEIQQVEAEIIRRLPLGSQASLTSLINEYTSRGISESAVQRAIRILVDRGTLQLRHQRKMVFRIGA